MTKHKLLAILLATTLAVAACDSTNSENPPSPSPMPTAAPTITVASNSDVKIKPPRGSLSAQQRQVFDVFSEFISAHYRFYSHPWFIDPAYARLVLPTTPFAPLEPDTIGQIGPVPVQVLSIKLTSAQQAKVEACVDQRALRYLGRDGAIDINGLDGHKLHGGVTWETTDFEHTTAAAADGSTSQSPRWIVSNGGSTAGTAQCQGLAASPPATPTPRTPVTAIPGS
jgi:hypothetical protein